MSLFIEEQEDQQSIVELTSITTCLEGQDLSDFLTELDFLHRDIETMPMFEVDLM